MTVHRKLTTACSLLIMMENCCSSNYQEKKTPFKTLKLITRRNLQADSSRVSGSPDAAGLSLPDGVWCTSALSFELRLLGLFLGISV